MNALAELSWRFYPALLLIVVGLVAAVWSIRRAVKLARRSADPWRALAIMRGGRRAVVALAVAAIGAAWWWQSAPLFGLALVIGGEELLESSVVIKAIEHGLPGARRPRSRSARSSTRGPAGRESRNAGCAACRA